MGKALAAVAVAALVLAGAASGVGPWPGTIRSLTTADGTRYTISYSADTTVVRALRGGSVVAKGEVYGRWGIPAVTSTGVAGGLSHDGKRLVLVEPTTYRIRQHSTFLLLSTRTLTSDGTVVLDGEFGFDALSPDGRTMYVIQHRNASDLVSYVVRAYDLRARHLLAGAVVAKGEGEQMRGYPVARATTPNGAWVYTLYYRSQPSTMFVHALQATKRRAVCIDLTWKPEGNVWETRLRLDGKTLQVRAGGRTVARINTAGL